MLIILNNLSLNLHNQTESTKYDCCSKAFIKIEKIERREREIKEEGGMEEGKEKGDFFEMPETAFL